MAGEAGCRGGREGCVPHAAPPALPLEVDITAFYYDDGAVGGAAVGGLVGLRVGGSSPAPPRSLRTTLGSGGVGRSSFPS